MSLLSAPASIYLPCIPNFCWQLLTSFSSPYLTLSPIFALLGGCRLTSSPLLFSPTLVIIYISHCFCSSPKLPCLIYSPSPLWPFLRSDIEAIWWIKVSQTVHRNKSPLSPALFSEYPAHRRVLALSISNRIVVP